MRIRQLTIATGDLEEQAAFYGGRLGLPVDVGEDEIEVRLRDSAIRFERAAVDLDARYHFAINVPGDSIEAAVRWLKERQEPLTFDGDPVRTDVGAGCVYFLDAAGNVLELIANPRIEADGGDFGPESLVEIGEVGIAASDVAATAAVLQETFEEPVFWSDSELTAVGDHHAVVIVAPTGRGWIPVDLTATPLPTAIVASGEEAREVTLPEGPYRLRVEPYRP